MKKKNKTVASFTIKVDPIQSDRSHLEAQKKYPASVQEDKRKKKPKYKKDILGE